MAPVWVRLQGGARQRGTSLYRARGRKFAFAACACAVCRSQKPPPRKRSRCRARQAAMTRLRTKRDRICPLSTGGTKVRPSCWWQRFRLPQAETLAPEQDSSRLREMRSECILCVGVSCPVATRIESGRASAGDKTNAVSLRGPPSLLSLQLIRRAGWMKVVLWFFEWACSPCPSAAAAANADGTDIHRLLSGRTLEKA